MAFQAGLLNVGGFMACHRFVSHVTGFATYFGVDIGNQEFGHALGMLVVPLLFLCGSMLSGLLVDIRLKLHLKPKYYIVFGVMFILIMTVVVGGFNGFFGQFGGPLNHSQGYLLLSLLCLICGLQNGTITSVSRAVVRTTHLTGITTDLGIGLVRVLNRGRLKENVDDDIRANWMRAGIIVFFGLGSLTGAFVFAQMNYRGFIVPAAITGILFATTIYFQTSRAKV